LHDRTRRALGGSDVRAVIATAVSVVRARPLLPPAATAFLGRHPEAESLLEVLPEGAVEALEDYLAGADPKRADGGTKLALRYAAATMQQEGVFRRFAEVKPESDPFHASLSDGDKARLEAYLLYLGIRGGPIRTLDSLIDAWSRLVDIMEHGDEHWMCEEHTNSLDGRDHLEIAMSLLTPTESQEVRAHVGTFDQRFFNATRPTPRSLRPHEPWQPQAWWWFRLPQQIGESFSSP
jgi:hypothetical protein